MTDSHTEYKGVRCHVLCATIRRAPPLHWRGAVPPPVARGVPSRRRWKEHWGIRQRHSHSGYGRLAGAVDNVDLGCRVGGWAYGLTAACRDVANVAVAPWPAYCNVCSVMRAYGWCDRGKVSRPCSAFSMSHVMDGIAEATERCNAWND